MASTDPRPIPCPSCAGVGSFDVPAVVHGYQPHPNVAWRWEKAPCEDCQGTGYVHCVGCDEPAVWQTDDGPACVECTEAWEADERRALSPMRRAS